MRIWIAAAFAGACASTQPPALLETCSEYRETRVDPLAHRHTPDQVKAQVHAIFAALDRADEAAFDAELGRTFAMIEGGVVRDHAYLVAGIRERAAQGAPERTRVWQNEQIWLSEEAAVFVGEAIVHEPGTPQNPSGDFAGWNTLVFAPDRGTLRAMSWQWTGR